MISKEAIKRGYNRGNYVVGAPTQPHYAGSIKEVGTEADLAQNAVAVDAALVEKLRGVADEVLTAREDLVVNTRDWWARTMVESIMAYSLSASCASVRIPRDGGHDSTLMADRVPPSWRTPFHGDGGQHSILMADT